MKIKTTFILFLLSTLSACGNGEPSEKDIKNAVQYQIDTLIKNSGGMMDAEDFKIHAIKKLGCSEERKRESYACDVEADIERPLVGRQKTTTKTYLVKTDDGWRVVE